MGHRRWGGSHRVTLVLAPAPRMLLAGRGRELLHESAPQFAKRIAMEACPKDHPIIGTGQSPFGTDGD